MRARAVLLAAGLVILAAAPVTVRDAPTAPALRAAARAGASAPAARPRATVRAAGTLTGRTMAQAPVIRTAAQNSGAGELLQAISVVDRDAVWVSGHGGTWGRTLDGGATWTTGVVPGADELQFRDVHALDAGTAVLMSAGPGEASQIFRTTDGGATWEHRLTNPDPEGFWDCIDFWEAGAAAPATASGLLYGDSVDGTLTVWSTGDGGSTWERVDAGRLPGALPGEGGFAASGTCVATGPGGRAWIATGAGERARVILTTDSGRSWQAVDAPLASGGAAGAASVAFHDALHGAVMGGDVGRHDVRYDAVAFSNDGGLTWSEPSRPAMSGAVYGGAWIPGTTPPALVIVGPGGVDVTFDRGASWSHVDDAVHWAVAFAAPDAGWAVGPEGRITRLEVGR